MHLSGIFHGTTSMKSARKRGFSNPPFCALTPLPVSEQSDTTVAKHYGRVSETPCFRGEHSQEIPSNSELLW